MKSKLLTSLILAALAAPSVTMAEDMETTKHKEGEHVIPASSYTVTANVGIVSNYLYRGISQTGANPALQGGFDYAHASGLYAGVWGSNISWISDAGAASNASVELDTYFGFKNSFAEDFAYDIGFLRYNYPGTYNAGFTKADTDEIYGSLGYKWITAKYSYSLGNIFGVAGAEGTDYIEVNASVPMADAGITFGAHVGKQAYKGPNAGSGATALSYTDYKLSVSKDFSGYVVGLTYSDTNASAAYTVLGKDLGKGTAVLSVTHAF